MMARKQDYQSAFDVIGPIMMGPSSSHTAGAVKIGNAARTLLQHEPQKLRFTITSRLLPRIRAWNRFGYSWRCSRFWDFR